MLEELLLKPCFVRYSALTAERVYLKLIKILIPAMISEKEEKSAIKALLFGVEQAEKKESASALYCPE